VSGGNTQPHSRIELPRSAPILTRRKRARLETSERERNGRDPNRKLRKRRPPTQYQPPTQLSHRHSSATDTAQPPTQLSHRHSPAPTNDAAPANEFVLPVADARRRQVTARRQVRGIGMFDELEPVWRRVSFAISEAVFGRLPRPPTDTRRYAAGQRLLETG
jgi:hypothetical protein